MLKKSDAKNVQGTKYRKYSWLNIHTIFFIYANDFSQTLKRVT